MERTEFLEMCQKCAVLKKRIGGVIEDLPSELTVTYDGVKYYPCRYELSFDARGNARHTAGLHDLNTSAIVHADLGRIK